MRGSILDALAIPFYVFSIAITLVVVYYVVLNINDAFKPFTTYGAKLDKVNEATTIVANLLPIIVIMLIIGSAILSYYTPAHPIFFPISIFLGALAIFISWIYNQVFEDVAAAFGGVPGAFGPMFAWVIGNLPLISVISYVIILIFLYLRPVIIERRVL